MLDMTMCKGTDCPKKESCRRYTATPNPHRQSWLAWPPIRDKSNKDDCNYYWPTKTEKKE
jgi:hypothetical protein